jgi:hypothetical protein
VDEFSSIKHDSGKVSLEGVDRQQEAVFVALASVVLDFRQRRSDGFEFCIEFLLLPFGAFGLLGGTSELFFDGLAI